MFTLTVGPVLENAENTFEYSLFENLFKIYVLLLLQNNPENPEVYHIQLKFLCNLIKSTKKKKKNYKHIVCMYVWSFHQCPHITCLELIS